MYVFLSPLQLSVPLLLFISVFQVLLYALGKQNRRIKFRPTVKTTDQFNKKKIIIKK